MVKKQQDADLILLARYSRSGDQEAFAILMKRYWGMVMKTCRRVLGTDLEVEDVAQTVFFKLALKSLRLSGGEDSVGGWLRKVALCEARNVRARQRARTLREERVAEARVLPTPPRDDVNEDRERILGVLDEELHELPTRYRDAISDFYMEDRSVQEIAEATGQSSKCIHNCLARGRKKLSERIKKRLSVTPAAVIGVLENLPEAPPMREGFIEETVRAAMQIRQGLTPTGLSPNVAKFLAAKGSWTLSKILAGVSALIICVAGGAVVTHHVLVRRATVASSTAPSEFAPETPVTSGMVLIPGGTNAGADPDTQKPYSLTVESFLMDRCEVTKALWDEVAVWGREHGYRFTQATSISAGSDEAVTLEVGQGKAPDHPVHSVSWWDCVLWCNARSEKDGFEPVYCNDKACTVVARTGPSRRGPFFVKATADGYRLPTLVEWQYAACGGKSSHRFPWHDTDTIDHTRANYGNPLSVVWDKSPTPGHHPTYAVEPKPYTSPVGAFPANAYGLYDMAGNVCEWCADAAGGMGMEGKYTGGSWQKIMGVHGSANLSSFERLLDQGFRTVRTPRASAPPHTEPDP